MKQMAEQLRRVDSLLKDIETVPTLPESIRQLQALLQNPDANIRLVADLILKDQVLTAHILRLANSSFFAVHREIRNVREAIVFLGFKAIQNLLLTTGLLRAFRWRGGSYDPRQFWKHSLACAMVSRDVATRLGFDDPETAYVAGLIHDVGLVLISQYLPEEMANVFDFLKTERTSLFEAERELLDVGHPAFGAWLGDKWGFPRPLIEVAFWHHEPHAQVEDPVLVAIVSFADLFCRSRNLGYGIVEYWSADLEAQPCWAILEARFPGLKKTDWERFAFDLDAKREEVHAIVYSMYASEAK